MNLLDYLGIQIEETTATQVRLFLVVTDQHKQPLVFCTVVSMPS